MSELAAAIVKAARLYSLHYVQGATGIINGETSSPAEPKPGDLVVECTVFSSMPRYQDCIAFVSTFREMPKDRREFFTRPLFPSDGAAEHRWENCTFRVVPEPLASVIRAIHAKTGELAKALDKACEHLEAHVSNPDYIVPPEERARLNLPAADIYYSDA